MRSQATTPSIRRPSLVSRRPAGTGLGLAVARGFVESFGGSLEAANRKDGRGAVLTLSLPRASEEEHGA